uniref:LysM domain-containing protein n=1 Tax=Kalanchoe fedtschenkoi TaxID=63787 RepID=A0A7N0VC60_KALFE
MSPAKKSLFNLVLVLSSILFISVPIPNCEKVFGVRNGDTCFEITQLFNLSTSFFELMNPNLVCNKLFVGEWVCVGGTLS